MHNIKLENQKNCNNENINLSTSCHLFESLIKHNLVEMDRHYKSLQHLKDSRQKRALINMMGNLNRFMFGNLEEDDLAEIIQTINNIQN